MKPDENRIFPCCIKMEGQHGLRDVYVGVPVKLGAGGVKQVIELKLNEDEMALLNASAQAVKSVMDAYDALGL